MSTCLQTQHADGVMRRDHHAQRNQNVCTAIKPASAAALFITCNNLYLDSIDQKL
jgi:hypothetical protein